MNTVLWHEYNYNYTYKNSIRCIVISKDVLEANLTLTVNTDC